MLRPRRDLAAQHLPGYVPQNAQIDEGFSLEFSPLLSVDRRVSSTRAIKCNIDQVEQMAEPVLVGGGAPTGGTRERAKIEVPQMSQFRFHERFRWPVDQVLLIGMGMVAPPVPIDNQLSLGGLPLPFRPRPRGPISW